MDEPRISLSVSMPKSVHAALVREAARRTTEAGRPIGAAAVVREAMLKALGLPDVHMPLGRPSMPPSSATSAASSTAQPIRVRTRSTPPAAA